MSIALPIDWAELDTAAPQWESLAAEAPGADPRMALPLLRVWAKHHLIGAQIRLLRVGRDNPSLLVPTVSLNRRRCGMPFRVLACPRDGFWECSEPPSSGSPVQAASALLERLVDEPAWDVLEIGPLLDDRPLVEALRSAAGIRSQTCEILPYAEDPIVRIHGGWQEYYAGRSANLRSSTGRSERKLAARGDVRFEVLHDTSALDDLFRVEASGWKGEAGSAIVSDPGTRAFWEELAGVAASHGWLRIYRLSVGGQCVAADLAILYGRAVYMFKMGYDAAWADCAPGRVLRKRTVEHLFASGEADIYGQLAAIGERNRHKYEWATEVRRYVVVRVYNPRSIAARLALGALTGRRRLGALARRSAGGERRSAA